MQDTDTLPVLRRLVELHHVYFDVLPELAISPGGERVRTGTVIRLWARHDKGARPLPGCEQCQALHGALSSVARWVLSNAQIISAYEVESFDRKLYATSDLASDEIGLSLVVRPRPGGDGVGDADGSIVESVKAIRRALALVGIYEGGWRRRPADASEGAPASGPREHPRVVAAESAPRRE